MKDFASLSVRLENNRFYILDQTELPHKEIWKQVENPDQMITYIKTLAVRGAPLIGISASISLALFSLHAQNHHEVLTNARKLRESRPTAVNLMNNLDSMVQVFHDSNFDSNSLLAEAERLVQEDILLCQSIANRGEKFIQDGDSVITHCNTGGLATVGIGTALGIIRKAHESGKKIHVYVDETRPLLQGARLTTWELEKLQIPYTLICDNMAGYLMSQRKIASAFIGADRIAVNGDVANKIGSYSLAVNARYHNVKFYVAAPQTTLDPHCATGASIPIEERAASEVRNDRAPVNAKTWNPSFDVVPRSLISEIILDHQLM